MTIWKKSIFIMPKKKKRLKKKRKIVNIVTPPAGKNNKSFYLSWEWKKLRYKALLLHGRQCMCCGAKPPQVRLIVDHIKPRSKFPELELEISNLQVLCNDCNMGKGGWDETDFRYEKEINTIQEDDEYWQKNL